MRQIKGKASIRDPCDGLVQLDNGIPGQLMLVRETVNLCQAVQHILNRPLIAYFGRGQSDEPEGGQELCDNASPVLANIATLGRLTMFHQRDEANEQFANNDSRQHAVALPKTTAGNVSEQEQRVVVA